MLVVHEILKLLLQETAVSNWTVPGTTKLLHFEW